MEVNQQWFDAEELHKAGVTDDEIRRTPGFRTRPRQAGFPIAGSVARIPDPKRPDLMMPDDWPRFANAVLNRVCRACGNSAGSAFTVHQQVVAGWRMMVHPGRHSQDICPACIECGRRPRGWDFLDAGEKTTGGWSDMISPAITPGPHQPADPDEGRRKVLEHFLNTPQDKLRVTKKAAELADLFELPEASVPWSCGTDPVFHPKHYGGFDDPFEAVKVIDAWGLGWNLGNVLKYIRRRFEKGDDVENLEKAAFYLDREIAAAKAGRRVPHG